MDDRLDRSSSSTSGIGRSASKSTNSARSSTNSFSDTDLEYGATLTERSLAKSNQENGVIFFAEMSFHNNTYNRASDWLPYKYCKLDLNISSKCFPLKLHNACDISYHKSYRL